MSKPIKLFLVIAFMAVTTFVLRPTNQIATTGTPVKKEEVTSLVQDDVEVFEFQKAVDVKFDFSKEIVNEGFDGLLYLDWSNENVATVSLSMPAHRGDIFIRAHFTEDHALRCIQAPVKLTEQESDYVHLLQSLVLDYSYKTNRDDNGYYEAKFTKEADLVTKIKTRYLNAVASGLKVKSSLHEIKLHDRMKEASGEEHYELFLNGGKTAEAVSKYSLKATSGKQRPEINLARELGECTSDFSQSAPITTSSSNEDLKETLKELGELDRGSRHGAMRKALKALRSDPGLLIVFMDWVSANLTDRQLTSMAVGILSNLGTPEAQREMVGLFKAANKKTPWLQGQVLNAFTLTLSPITDESRDFLKAQINGSNEHMAEGAAYALGASIANDPESEGSRQDLAFLQKAHDSAQTPRTKKIYLDALLNSEHPL